MSSRAADVLRPQRRPFLGLVAGAALALSCDPTPGRRDASVPLSQRVSEVSVRIDAAGDGAPAVSILAFRASISGLAPAEVLGVVDPLMAPAPERATGPDGHCEVRDVASAARGLRAQGGAVELEELSDVAVTVGAEPQQLIPAPRVYPQLAATVGGVIGEAGPRDLSGMPGGVTVTLPGATPARLGLPGVPRILDAAGQPLSASTRFGEDLVLTVTGPDRTFIEVRPFGASLALACSVGPSGRVVVPLQMALRVMPASGHVPVSFEAVWRDEGQTVQLAQGQSAHLSLEARSSTVLDLRAATTTVP
jgi:hypothetical protein